MVYMTSLRELPIPGVCLCLDSENEDDNRSTSSWDSTYQPEPAASSLEPHRNLCSHAVSIGCTVFGVKDHEGRSSLSEDGEKWWTWQRSLEHVVIKQVPCSVGSVNSIASNSNGTVIAAATDAGVVALLRGSDGAVLATRSVCSPDRLSSAIRLTWISCSSALDNPCDSLLMEIPIGTDDAIGSGCSNSNSQLIVVTNIHGLRLNHLDSVIVSEAARNTQIISIPINSTLSKYDVRAITACGSTTADIIRLVACDSDSQLILLDFHCSTQELQLIQEQVPLGIDAATIETDRWIDFELGLYATRSSPPLILCSALLHSKVSMLFWFNPRTMQTVCQFPIPIEENSSDGASSACGSKVMAMESVSSWSNSDTLAFVVAVKPTVKNGTSPLSSITNILVVQVLLDEIMGLTVVYCPHLLYTIPIQDKITSITLAAVLPSVVPFSFRFHIWNIDSRRENSRIFKEFQPNVSLSKTIGEIRFCIHRKDFDQADTLIASVGVEALIMEPFANFHPSEVAYHRLQLAWHDPSRDTEEETQLCLRQLASGVIASGTNNTKAFALLTNAVRFLTNDKSSIQLSLDTFFRILEMMASTLKTVMESIPPTLVSEVVPTSLDAILKKVAALKVFKTISAGASSSYHHSHLATPFLTFQSIPHLYEICMLEHHFVLAEAVYLRSRNEFCWSTTALVKPLLLNVKGSDVIPKDYLFVISDVIFPNLVLNDANLPKLKLWSCQMADSLDDADANEANLDSAVLLLETVDKEIRKLRMQRYTSCCFNSPTDRSKENGCQLGTLRVSASLDNCLDQCEPLSNSRASKLKSSSGGRGGNSEGPLPTILEISALQRGLRNASSIVADDDSIHDKLYQAQCIQTARRLGLSKEATTLRNFSSSGGSEHLAKELGCFSLTTASTHEDRMQFLMEQVIPFCKQFSICFDQVMYDCASEICCGKSVSSKSIEECCSIVRCCSSNKMRCKIILVILRAALSCGAANVMLLQLSKEAISSWASSTSNLRSEMEEAFRLLQIDAIVVRYCGLGARELFRVENPRHQIRLLHFVTQHVGVGSVVDDIIALCDGFNHLCRRKACCQLLENALLHHASEDVALQVFKKLIRKDEALAEHALAATVCLAEFILEERSVLINVASQSFRERLEPYRQQPFCICSRIGSMLSCALENRLSLSPASVSILRNSLNLEHLHASFTRIERLESDFSVLTSMGAMSTTSTLASVVVDFIGRSLSQKLSCEQEVSQHKLSMAKRVCSILTAGSSVDIHDLWVLSSAILIASKAKEWNDKLLTKFIMDVALFSNVRTRSRSQICTSLLSSLLRLNGVESSAYLFGMRRMAAVASFLKNCLMLSSQDKELVANIELSSSLEMICQVFIRCDEGFGEDVECLRREIEPLRLCQTLTIPLASSKTGAPVKSSIHRPTLHPPWYVGDGILLPPGEAFRKSLRLFNDESLVLGIQDVFDLVSNRGAHSLSLRILCESSSFQNCCINVSNADSTTAFLHEKICETTNALAVRNLGGTGSGITSSAIDSQLAVSFLWLLPKKHAFDAYQCCLPTALKTRNFDRLFILSNIGIVAGSKGIGTDSTIALSWKKQDMFFDVCSQLATKVKWWSILRYINVHFDPYRFVDPFANIGKSAMCPSTEMETEYAVTLLPSFLLAASQILGTSHLMWLLFSFADAFGVPLSSAVSKHIEFLLSPDNVSRSLYKEDRREERVLELLQHLNPPTKRIEILRRCLQKLEGSESVDVEYELYNLVLRLYRENLLLEIENDHKIQNNAVEAELDAVDRRRDALAILSAFFQDNLLSSRPRFSSFFEPFGELEGHFKTLPQCGILGKKYTSGEVFDPLEEIEKVFATYHEQRALTALAPLCIPLRIPNGYIHARSLIAQFEYSQSNRIEYPSFDGDVFPVLKRIGSSIDKANLAEWCANQYNNNEGEKLKCLDILLQNTIQASTEIERRRHHFPNDALLIQEEQDLLEKVKRITALKATLSDSFRVKKLLISDESVKTRTAKLLTGLLVAELDRYVLSNPEVSPEALIDFLYITGSHIVSHKHLSHKSSFSIATFRPFCSLVHSACKAIAEQYSHIDLFGRTRLIAHRWLFYGDSGDSVYSKDNAQIYAPACVVNEEPTSDIVTDSFILHTSHIRLQRQKGTLSIGGNSVLGMSTVRELSEYMSQHAALRIAFVMGSSIALSSQFAEEVDEKENLNISDHSQMLSSKRTSLLSQRKMKRELRHDSMVFELGLELLQIVFAKFSASSDLISRFRSNDSISSALSETNDNASTITFAMRHRALLAARILCPQEALEEIVRCEGFLRSSDQVESCSLQQCLFGVFVAKEIEEIGLPLPHSDLLQLSSMNFLSYARALWRDHRVDDINERSNGRFLLLLIEMSLKHEDCDFNFVCVLLKELTRIKLLRTLLICLELIAGIFHRVDESQILLSDSVRKAATLISDETMNELSRLISSQSGFEKADETRTLKIVERMFMVFSCVLDSNSIVCHCKEYLDFLSSNINELSTIYKDLLSIVHQAQQRAERADFSNTATNPIISSNI